MGASQSTRDIPDYVGVYLDVQPDQTIKLYLCVCNTNFKYKIRTYLQEKEVLEKNSQLLPPSVNSRQANDVYLHLHTDESEKPQVSLHVTKTLEELIKERDLFLEEIRSQQKCIQTKSLKNIDIDS